ncbi:MAG: sigma-70 family RNA polymerase sigma factor [Lentisphaeria bacterium]|nr:sigma-70 family RNA polymerase sigma factor [Victivallales bacterium]MBR6057119.1 sigma-70 family RNA polymerase sigma factor [Victivallales bacterium]MCR4572856.1 sigma-70 family RNA polymerase sigma factor [Lentisphaeria bacterium]
MNEDQQLIERFKSGDELAFDQLVRKHTSRAYGIAYGILGSREDAQEVAQDAFIRIHHALPNFRGDSEFTTWMYRIVTNLAKNKYRWNKCRGSKVTSSLNAPIDGTDGDNALFFEAPDERMAPDEALRFSELERRTQEAMAALPEAYREALILRNVKEMSYEDIATMLGCKLGTIKSRINRAREELRSKLGL